jgi:hypothetical protein
MAAKKKAEKKGRRATASKSKALARRAPAGAGRALSLPSGRSIRLVADGSREELEVRSPDGAMELRISLTKDGPVLSLSGARLEINSSDAVSVNCRAFEVHAEQSVRLSTAGDVAIAASGAMRARTGGQMHLDGELVNINCGDRTGYPDEKSAALAQAAIDKVLSERAASAEPGPKGGGCDHH